MINYKGLYVESVEENRITFTFHNHNVMGLTIFFEEGTGYKDGDKIEVLIKNHGCTNWEGDAQRNEHKELEQVRFSVSGTSESEMTTTIFSLTAMVLQYRRDSISMQQIAEIIKRRISNLVDQQ